MNHTTPLRRAIGLFGGALLAFAAAAPPTAHADPQVGPKAALHAASSDRLRVGGAADTPNPASTDTTTITTSAGPGKSPIAKGGAVSRVPKAPESLPCRPSKKKPPPPGYCGS